MYISSEKSKINHLKTPRKISSFMFKTFQHKFSVMDCVSVQQHRRKFISTAPDQSLYIGVEIEASMQDPYCKLGLYVHDGFCGVEYLSDSFYNQKLEETDYLEKSNLDAQGMYDLAVGILEDQILQYIAGYANRAHNIKIQVCGLGIQINHQRVCKELNGMCLNDLSVAFWERNVCPHEPLQIRLLSRLWAEMDILPVLVCTDMRGSVDERACSAVRKAIVHINPHILSNIPRIQVGFRHEVEVDCGGTIRYCNIPDYAATIDSDTWNKFRQLCQKFKNQDWSISFFNSTPIGGGVAIMRHSIIRLLSIMGVNAHWYVAKPKPDVFQITKLKFHNVLQGVAPPETHLTDEEKQLYEKWCASNAIHSWKTGPFEDSTFLVFDDPQLVGAIGWANSSTSRKSASPKIIFRCHIQVQKDLIVDRTTETSRVWNYLWDLGLKDCDAYVFHPSESFVPPGIPADKLRFIPAFIDPLDGLNKEMSHQVLLYYWSIFNRIAMDTTGKWVQFEKRPYIAQIARFDPSKGIPDVIQAYVRTRAILEKCVPFVRLPQLVIAGIGAIDDPQGNSIYDQMCRYTEEDQFVDVYNDILLVKLPPSDQLLNALLEGCHVYVQLSHREGFEVKVTEALRKGKPTIAYRAGGLPLQISDGKNGFLVETGDIDSVVEKLVQLWSDELLYQKMSCFAKAEPRKEFTVVHNAMTWLEYLASMKEKEIPLSDGV